MRRQIADPLLWISAQLAGSTALGIVFLMTTKPGLDGSLLALGVAISLEDGGPHPRALSLRGEG